MDCKTKTYKTTNIISFFIFILAFIFIFIQSIKNIKYNRNENNLIIAERLVYEEFAHVVYSNIKSKIIYGIEEVEKNENCREGYNIMSFPIKIETFYDCAGVKDSSDNNIDPDFCLDKITKASMCCRKGCCLKNINNKKENGFCVDKLTYDEQDPRNLNCSKFSQYNGRFYIKEGKKICVKKENKTYEDLLSISQNNYCSIALDSKNHYLCNYDFLNNSGNIIVKNLFSLSEPDYFEMESKIRLSILLNKKKFDEEIIKKEYNRISKISSKNIYEAFYTDKCFQNCYDSQNYIFYGSLKLSDIIEKSDELIFKNFKDNDYIKNNNINWYTRNYIGFNNITELNKFKIYFDSNDYKNNSLYKISKNLIPNYFSATIGPLICISLIIFIYFSIARYKKDEEIDLIIKFNINNIKFIFVLIFFIIYLIEYLYQCFQFEEIYIDMENFYSKIIEKYNDRRKQIYLLIGLIIFSFNLFFELLIQNLKLDITRIIGANGNSKNIIISYIKYKNINCRHKIKFNKNKTFSEHIPNIQNILKRCNNCKDNDIEDFYFNNNKIDNLDNIINEIGIKGDSEILIED